MRLLERTLEQSLGLEGYTQFTDGERLRDKLSRNNPCNTCPLAQQRLFKKMTCRVAVDLASIEDGLAQPTSTTIATLRVVLSAMRRGISSESETQPYITPPDCPIGRIIGASSERGSDLLGGAVQVTELKEAAKFYENR